MVAFCLWSLAESYRDLATAETQREDYLLKTLNVSTIGEARTLPVEFLLSSAMISYTVFVGAPLRIEEELIIVTTRRR